VVRLTVDLTQNLYDCLEEKARQRQRERGGGRASKAEVIRELLSDACKRGEGRNSITALRRRPGAGRRAR